VGVWEILKDFLLLCKNPDPSKLVIWRSFLDETVTENPALLHKLPVPIGWILDGTLQSIYAPEVKTCFIYIYTWNPNVPSFDWKRPCFGGKTKDKWVPGIYIAP